MHCTCSRARSFMSGRPAADPGREKSGSCCRPDDSGTSCREGASSTYSGSGLPDASPTYFDTGTLSQSRRRTMVLCHGDCTVRSAKCQCRLPWSERMKGSLVLTVLHVCHQMCAKPVCQSSPNIESHSRRGAMVLCHEDCTVRSASLCSIGIGFGRAQTGAKSQR